MTAATAGRSATALAAKGVLVAPGDCFGMPEHMRVGFALLKHEKFLEALAIFERVLRGAIGLVNPASISERGDLRQRCR